MSSEVVAPAPQAAPPQPGASPRGTATPADVARQALNEATLRAQRAAAQQLESGEAARVEYDAWTALDAQHAYVAELRQLLAEAVECEAELEAAHADAAQRSVRVHESAATLAASAAELADEEERARAALEEALESERAYRSAVASCRVERMGVAEVAWLLSECGLAGAAGAFAEAKVDGVALAELDDADLEGLGVAQMGDRKRLLAAVRTVEACGAIEVSDGVLRALAEEVRPGKEADCVLCSLWSVDEVAERVLRAGLGEKVAARVRELGVDGRQMLCFTSRDLEAIGVSELGDRKKLAKKLRERCDEHFRRLALMSGSAGCREDEGEVHVKGGGENVEESDEELEDENYGEDCASCSKLCEAAEEPPNEYVCPITQQLMMDPTVVEAGNIYERDAIE
eukprot:m51a1_g586 hypothetical protein (400) ;mRNA; r:12426-13798